jgi:integrase
MRRIDLKVAIAAGSATVAAPKDMAFSELVAGFAALHFDGSGSRLRKWVALFADRSAWAVTGPEISAALSAMEAQGYSPATINRDLSALGSIYKWARKRHLSPPGFLAPTMGVERRGEPARVVVFTREEARALLAGSLAFRDRRFGVLVHLLHDTGARRSEVLNRTWSQFNTDKRQILAPVTKTERPRVLFYSPETAALLDRVFPKGKRAPDAMPFGARTPGRFSEFKRQWDALTKGIGRPDLNMHDLRHHRAAEMLRSGKTLASTAQVLGHSTTILARRYGHLDTAHLEQTVAASW